jgi:hypothetical protein
MSATGRGAPAQSATADREIVISRVIDAPRELVFEAFTEVRHLSRWWGPRGSPPPRGLRVPRRRGVGLRDARTGRDGLPGVDLLDRDRPPERIALLHGESRGDPNAFESV